MYTVQRGGARRWPLAALLFSIAAMLPLFSAAAADGSRMVWDGKERLFINVKADGTIDKGGVLFSQPGAAGPFFIAERRADGSISPDRATIALDAAGRVTSILSKDMRSYIRFTADGASLSNATKKGSYGKTIVSANPAVPALILPFLAGSFPLYEPGQAQGLSLVVFKAEGIEAYEGRLRVLRAERVATMAGAYEALVLELGVAGFAGLFVPKVPIWIDAATRQTVKIGFPNSSLELAELR